MVKILLIEDEVAIRENMLELLQAEDFEAIGASNSKEGICIAKQQIPDLIICDVMMPGANGFEVLETLRRTSATATIPFIFLTALADKNSMRRGMVLGADDYLSKPCTADELLQAIAARLQKQAAVARHYNNALKQVSTQINRYLHYDLLTDLPNRFLLEKQFQQIVAQQVAMKNSQAEVKTLIDPSQFSSQDSQPTAQKLRDSQIIPVLCLGLDRLPQLYNICGHSGVQSIFKSIAKRLQDFIGDRGIVASLNSEQFVIVLSETNQKKVAANIAESLLQLFVSGFAVNGNGKEIFTTASIGIALYSRDGWDIETLLHNASKAMNRARIDGGNRHEFYTAIFNLGISEQLAIEAELHYAIERGQFHLHYQPQVNLQTGAIVGAEAIARWHHPEWGLVPPNKFIPLAEETGLIERIDEWVLQAVCQQIRYWHSRLSQRLKIGVNISVRQLNKVDLRQRLMGIAIAAGIHPQYLEIELAESALINNSDRASSRLNALKALGFSIASDDFGASYFSLKQLPKLPFNVLKLDSCLIREVVSKPEDAAIAKRSLREIAAAIIQMAQELKLKVVAKGVESADELNFLYQHRCDEIQGNLFSEPLPADKFTKLLFSGKRLQIEPIPLPTN